MLLQKVKFNVENWIILEMWDLLLYFVSVRSIGLSFFDAKFLPFPCSMYTDRETIFPSPFIYLHNKVSPPPPLTNFVIYPLCFLTAFVMMSWPQLFSRKRGGASDKKPRLIQLCVCSWNSKRLVNTIILKRDFLFCSIVEENMSQSNLIMCVCVNQID